MYSRYASSCKKKEKGILGPGNFGSGRFNSFKNADKF
jgi:hypothetical protein